VGKRIWEVSKEVVIQTHIDLINILKSLDSFLFGQGHTVSQAFYVEILTWLCEVVHSKRYELWRHNWFVSQDNAPAH
jgi:hypothetical protein